MVSDFNKMDTFDSIKEEYRHKLRSLKTDWFKQEKANLLCMRGTEEGNKRTKDRIPNRDHNSRAATEGILKSGQETAFLRASPGKEEKADPILQRRSRKAEERDTIGQAS